MKYFAYFCALSVLCIWNFHKFTQAELAPPSISDIFHYRESFICDDSHVEAQLETLKTGNDVLKIQLQLLQTQLNKQKEISKNLERKIDDLPKQMQIMQEKLLLVNKLNIEDLKDVLSRQIQNQMPALTPVDNKLFILAGIKEKLQDHTKLLNNIESKQNNSETLLRDANCQNHIKTLENSFSNKFKIMEKIQSNLENIENRIMTRTEQLQFHRDFQQYFSKNDETKICYKSENNNLLCTPQSYPTNCADFNEIHCRDNKCRINNQLYGRESFLVSCNDKEEGGGWTVIQRRINGSVDFYRNWSEYKNGFGNVDGEFFIGLDKLHALTATLKPVELLIQMEDFNDTMKYAKYDDFQVANETENYKLIKVGAYYGNAGDSFSLHVGKGFSTKDRDNDDDSTANCAADKTGAWWYKSCMWSNLNGKYYANGVITDGKRGICWFDFHGYNYSLKSVQMMIRPKRL